jgi:hypothetical protein
VVIDMDESRLPAISRLSAFLEGIRELRFDVPASDDERYADIDAMAQRFGHA